MQVSVMIEQQPGNGFSAKAGDPFGFCVHGASRDEVLGKIREMIEKKVHAEGTEVVQLEIPVAENPRLRMAGFLDPNDPMVQEWIKDMAEYRKQRDAQLDEL